MSDGMQDKVEGKLKETEGKLTDDTIARSRARRSRRWARRRTRRTS